MFQIFFEMFYSEKKAKVLGRIMSGGELIKNWRILKVGVKNKCVKG